MDLKRSTTSNNSHVHSSSVDVVLFGCSSEFYWFCSDDQLTGIFPFVQGNGHTLIYCIDFWDVNQWDLKTGVSSLITGGAQLLSWVGGWVRQQLTKPTGSNGLRCHADRILKVLFFIFFSSMGFSLSPLWWATLVHGNFFVCIQNTCKSACAKIQLNATVKYFSKKREMMLKTFKITWNVKLCGS